MSISSHRTAWLTAAAVVVIAGAAMFSAGMGEQPSRWRGITNSEVDWNHPMTRGVILENPAEEAGLVFAPIDPNVDSDLVIVMANHPSEGDGLGDIVVWSYADQDLGRFLIKEQVGDSIATQAEFAQLSAQTPGCVTSPVPGSEALATSCIGGGARGIVEVLPGVQAFTMTGEGEGGLTISFAKYLVPIELSDGARADRVKDLIPSPALEVTVWTQDNPAIGAEQLVDIVRDSYRYPFKGFLPPVKSMVKSNPAKAGRTIPLKFSLSGDYSLNVLDAVESVGTDCATGEATSGPIDAQSPGSATFDYDATTDSYQFNWKTDGAWGGSCRRVTLSLVDGSNHSASFRFT